MTENPFVVNLELQSNVKLGSYSAFTSCDDRSSLKRFEISKRSCVRDWGMHVFSNGATVTDFSNEKGVFNLKRDSQQPY